MELRLQDARSAMSKAMIGRVSKWLVTCAGVAVILACALPGCGSDSPAAATASSSGTTTSGGTVDGGGSTACGTPQDGCPCGPEGQTVECGRVEIHSGNQTLCSIGTRTCTGGTWSTCQGTNKIVSSLGPDGSDSLHTQTLGSSQACGSSLDPCDPYCNVFTDDPTGLTLPPGLTVGTGGITVTGTTQAIACKIPTDWTAVYGAETGNNRSNGASPTTCATSPNPNCGEDLTCSSGKCIQRAVGDSGSCTGNDFTLGSPCWDGSRWELQVCNRGTTAATTGTLVIAHHTGIANADPSTCAAETSGAAGDCTIDLTAKPLQPGQCTSFIPTIDCAVNVPNETGDHYYVVNSSNTGATTRAECNTCNNFTATTAAASTLPGAACTSISCGGATVTSTQPSTIAATTTGLNSCAGSADVITNPCSTNPDKLCQQDFHCDTSTNTCVWNQKSEYTDSACTAGTGVDLTIGAGCNNGSSYEVPICNRGTKALSAGNVIKVALVNSSGFNSYETSCTAGAGTGGWCNHTLVAPLGPGQCVNATCTSGPGGQRWAIVNSDNSISECGGTGGGCLNNASQQKDNGSGCTNCVCPSNTAELTGTILDPAKLRPVYGVTVYVPSTTVGALDGPNVTCDTCANVFKGLPAVASTTTDVDGTFRLQGVPAGTSFPLVIQLGRFRRQVTVPAIPACGTASLAAAQAHLPATHTKSGDTATDTAAPDMPKVAFITGHGDALECLLLKMGIDVSEFTKPGAGGNFEMYDYKLSNGLSGTAGVPSSLAGLTFSGGQTATCTTSTCKNARAATMGDADALFSSSTTLDQYNAVIMPCADGNTYPTTTMQSNFRTWLDAGGRVFASHHAVEDFIRNPNDGTNPDKNIATWSFTGTPQGSTGWASSSALDQLDRAGNTPSSPSGGSTLTSTIDQTFTHGAALASWMNNTWNTAGGPGSGAPTFGTIPLPNYRHDVSAATSQSTAWFSGKSTYTGATNPSQVSMLSFDAPVGNAAASQCGRAVLPFMHVTTGVAAFDGTGSPTAVPTFPTACGTYPNRLTGQELAFEFMMWESMTCLSPATSTPVSPQPAPLPAPTPLTNAILTRDFTATCPSGTKVVWGFFQWQSVTALGTSIAFRAATGTSSTVFPTDPNDPSTVPIGTASGAAVVAPTWGQDANTVDWHLTNATPAQASNDVLHVYMTLQVASPAAPILTGWRQLYDCIPNE